MRDFVSGLRAFRFLVLLLASTPLGVSVADDSVMVIARLYATAGREAELEARILKPIEFVRKAEPDITYRAYRSQKDPSMFVYYEVYPSQTAFDRHAKETMPAFRKEQRDLLSVAPEHTISCASPSCSSAILALAHLEAS